MPGVVKGEPVPTCVPPVAASYHFKIPPAQPEADKLSVPVPQREAPVPDGAVGIVFTVPVTCVLGLIHPLASVQLTQ